MSLIFDPSKELQRLGVKKKVHRLISSKLSLKKAVLATISNVKFDLDIKQIEKVALKTLKSYRDRLKKQDSDDRVELKEEILSNPKLLVQRVQNAVVFQIHEEIKQKYRGEKARWLPSDAEEPRPEHQLYYGKVYTIGEGINGVEPGDKPGCKCGVEILTQDESLEL